MSRPLLSLVVRWCSPGRGSRDGAQLTPAGPENWCPVIDVRGMRQRQIDPSPQELQSGFDQKSLRRADVDGGKSAIGSGSVRRVHSLTAADHSGSTPGVWCGSGGRLTGPSPWDSKDTRGKETSACPGGGQRVAENGGNERAVPASEHLRKKQRQGESGTNQTPVPVPRFPTGCMISAFYRFNSCELWGVRQSRSHSQSDHRGRGSLDCLLPDLSQFERRYRCGVPVQPL